MSEETQGAAVAVADPSNPTDAEVEAAARALGVHEGAGIEPPKDDSSQSEPTQPKSGVDEATPQEQSKADPAQAGDKGGEAKGEGGQQDQQPAKKSGVSRLLEQRNDYKNQVENLKTEVAALRQNPNDKSGEGEGDQSDPAASKKVEAKPVVDPDLADDAPLTVGAWKKMQAIAESKGKDQSAKENLFKTVPEAAEFTGDVDKLMEAHPSISAEAALRMAAPHLFVGDNAPGNKLDAGGGTSTPAQLQKSKTPQDMTTKELEAHLAQAEKEGTLGV